MSIQQSDIGSSVRSDLVSLGWEAIGPIILYKDPLSGNLTTASDAIFLQRNRDRDADKSPSIEYEVGNAQG